MTTLRMALLVAIGMAAAFPLEDSIPLDLREAQARTLVGDDTTDLIKVVRVGLERLDASPGDLAWYALAVSDAGLTDALPAVATALTRVLDSEDAADDVCLPWLVDALIRRSMEPVAKTDVDRLLAHEHLTYEGLILAARKPADHRDALLEALRAGRDQRNWLCVAGLLVAERHPAIAARLLEQVQLQLEVAVVQPGQVPIEPQYRHGLRTMVFGRLGPDTIPFVHYGFVHGMAEDPADQVVSGPYPLYRHRYDSRTNHHGRQGNGLGDPSKEALRLVSLGLAVNFDAKIPLDNNLRRPVVEWGRGEDLLAKVGEHRQAFIDDWNSLLAHLQEQKLLTTEQAASLTPVIHVELWDQRNGGRDIEFFADEEQMPASELPLPKLPSEWDQTF